MQRRKRPGRSNVGWASDALYAHQLSHQKLVLGNAMRNSNLFDAIIRTPLRKLATSTALLLQQTQLLFPQVLQSL